MKWMLDKVLGLLTVVLSLIFVVTGLRWLVAPSGVAPEFGLALGEGLARSSQVGDLSAFFLTLGLCPLIGLVTGRRSWFYPAIMLLLIAATGRTVAWLLHDAALTPLILVEVFAALLLLAAAGRSARGI